MAARIMTETESRCTLKDAREAFMLRCRAQSLSPLTQGWYQDKLGALERFLDACGVESPREVTPHLIRLHLDKLREAGQKSGTVFRTFGALKCFFGFLARERLIPQNPMMVIERPRKSKRLIEALTLEQTRLLLAQPDRTTFAGLRTWTIMVLIFDSGLRISEALGLRRDQVDFQKNILRVIGKGDKEREVPFGTNAKQALWAYSTRTGDLEGQDLFFVDQFGRGLKPRWTQQQIKAYGEKAGITGVRVSPHTLRHTFATQYILNGGDAFSLQKILGHSSLDMVRVYVDLANRDVALQHRKFSPIDRLGTLPGDRRRVRIK